MTGWPTPTRADHEAFCRREGWERAYEARLHDPREPVQIRRSTYVLALPGATPLHTRVSQPADSTPYGPLLWAHILRDQLAVSEAAFWACVLDGVLPTRGAPELRPARLPERGAPELRPARLPDRGTPELRPTRLPEQLVHLLNAASGLPDPGLENAARRAAVAHLRQHWAAER
jgi:hypothetical protein